MKIRVNDVELYYEVTGQGRPLIMIHGNGEDHHIFDIANQELKKYFQVYLVDSRGHGSSSKINSYHYQDMALDVREMIIQLDLKDVIYYGYSDGGVVGLLLASQYPQLISKLIVSGANLHPRGVAQECYQEMKTEYKKTKSPLIKMMLEEPHIDSRDLKQIQASTLILAGEHDLILEEHTRKIARHIPRSQLEIIPGEDHGSYIVDSRKIAHYIIDFIKKDDCCHR